MRCEMASACDRAALQALWKTCFGDDTAYTDIYFDRYDISQRVFVAREGATIAAMAIWFPVTLADADGEEIPAAYLYAVATAPQFRRRGVCRDLMAFAEKHLKALGVQAVTLVPGSSELFRFYEKLGYQTAFFCQEIKVTAPQAGIAIRPTYANRYWQLRQMLLWQDFLSYDEEEVAYQKAICRHSGGDLVQLQLEDQLACAIAEPQGEQLMVKEVLPPEVAEQVGAALLARFGGKSAIVRTCGTQKAFGMIKWLRSAKLCQAAYLGLAFD